MTLTLRKNSRITRSRIFKKSFTGPTRCPLCGVRNECGLVAGAQDCWCFSQLVQWQPPQGFSPQIGSAACLCRLCMMSQKALDRALEQTALILKQRE